MSRSETTKETHTYCIISLMKRCGFPSWHVSIWYETNFLGGILCVSLMREQTLLYNNIDRLIEIKEWQIFISKRYKMKITYKFLVQWIKFESWITWVVKLIPKLDFDPPFRAGIFFILHFCWNLIFIFVFLVIYMFFCIIFILNN